MFKLKRKLVIGKVIKPYAKKSILQDNETDPLGMYTGTPSVGIMPVQDHDDL